MENQNKQSQSLRFIDEFRALLADYQPDNTTIEKLKATQLVLLVGPTAAGRNTLISILVGTGRYHYLISDTTRQPRENNGVMEQNGVEYWFKTEEEFLQGLKEGGYVEAAVIHNQQVSGMSVKGLEEARKAGRIAIDEIEPDGAAHIHAYDPSPLFIFLLPPTFDIWMERLRARGHMPEEEVRRRLESAKEEIATALAEEYYQFVINNEIHEAAAAVDELANGRAPDPKKQQHGRSHAEQLAMDVELYLTQNQDTL